MRLVPSEESAWSEIHKARANRQHNHNDRVARIEANDYPPGSLSRKSWDLAHVEHGPVLTQFDFPCSRCGASVDEPCTIRGYLSPMSHKARWDRWFSYERKHLQKVSRTDDRIFNRLIDDEGGDR